jgi:hypothetical protein
MVTFHFDCRLTYLVTTKKSWDPGRHQSSSKATLHDYDLVGGLGDGEVIEVGRPSALEEDPRSNFASMLAAERGGEHF